MSYAHDMQRLAAWVAQQLPQASAGRELTLVDCAPFDGERAWRVLSWLQMQEIVCRYWVCCDTPELRASLAAHPFLQPWCEQGSLQLLLWPSSQAAWHCLWDTIQSQEPSSVLVWADTLASALENRVFACHYGQCLAWQPVGEASAEGWQAMDLTQHSAALQNILLSHLQGLNSASFSVPSGFLQFLALLQAADLPAVTVLMGDHGYLELSALREAGLALDRSQQACEGVNFYALQQGLCDLQMSAQWQQDGAWVWGAIHLGANAEAADLHPDTAPQRLRAQLLQSLTHWPPALLQQQAWALWSASASDEAYFLALFPHLLATASNQTGPAKNAARRLLRQCFDEHFLQTTEADPFYYQLAVLAAELGCYGDARALLNLSERYAYCDPAHHALLARCYEASGEHSAALDAWRIAAMNDTVWQTEAHAAEQRQQAWQALSYHYSAPAQATPDGASVTLQPLDSAHFASLLYQYRDPQIGLMTRLPAFENEAALADWLATRHASPSRREFAVIHANFGFIGMVSAQCIGPSAFVHFWLGLDYQGMGFMQPSLLALCAHLQSEGVQQAFTAVYPDNYRSLRTLLGVEFQALAICALPPENEMLFYAKTLVGEWDTMQLEAALYSYSEASEGVFRFINPELREVVAA